MMYAIPRTYTNLGEPDQSKRYTMKWLYTDAAGYHTYVLSNYQGIELQLNRLTTEKVFEIMNNMHETFMTYIPIQNCV